MAARSTKLTVRNLTAFPLRHVSDSLEFGIWTEPLRPPPEIPAGATMWWESESDGVAQGTEGRAEYQIGDTGVPITWYWDNPYLGMNSYRQTVGPGFGISFSGGLGDDANPIYTVAPDTPVVVPDFLPSRNALQFTNHFEPTALAHLVMPDPFADIPIGNASNGMCGGMTYLTADYYHAGVRAPEGDTPVPPSRIPPVPPSGSPLFTNMTFRLFNSFNVPDGVYDYLTYMDPLYGDSDNLIDNGRAWVMAHVQWPQIKAVIDAGHPCPIGLVMVKSLLPFDLGENHQVLVYGYKLAGNTLTLRVYDPNSAGAVKGDNVSAEDDVTLTLDLSRTDERIVVEHNVNVHEDNDHDKPLLPVYCFFVTKYTPLPAVEGIPRLPLSVRQFLVSHEFDPATGIARHVRQRGVHSVRELLKTP